MKITLRNTLTTEIVDFQPCPKVDNNHLNLIISECFININIYIYIYIYITRTGMVFHWIRNMAAILGWGGVAVGLQI